MQRETWNLACVITRLELGGAQLVALHMARHSRFPRGERYVLYGPGGILDREARAQETGLVADGGGVSPLIFREVPALVRELSPLVDVLCLAQLTHTLRRLFRSRPGERWIVHTHSSKAGILGRLAARAAGADLIVHTIHGFGHHRGDPPWRRRALIAAEQAAAQVTDGFTAVSLANIAQGHAERILGRVPARLVRCGIDIARFAAPKQEAAATRREIGIPEGDAVVLNVSCLKPQKDPLAFVELAARVVADRPCTTFLLAGDGELRGAVEAAIRRGGTGKLRLLGWRSDIPELLHASDVLVLTSRWEGLPQTFLQAMAAKKPIVATRVDGGPEAVRHGVNGLLYEVGDLDGMSAGLVSLLDDRDRCAAMGARGREALPDFSQERMVEDLDRFYEELAAGLV